MKRTLTVETENGELLGSGFLLEHGLVLTAAHCLKGLAELTVRVLIYTQDGVPMKFKGRARLDHELDVATIEIQAPTLLLKLYVLERIFEVPRNVPWRCENMNPNFSGLFGEILDPKKVRQLHLDKPLESLELSIKEPDVYTFRHYSGGAVEVAQKDPSRAWAVAGMMLAELKECPDGDRASNLVYASTLYTISRSHLLTDTVLEVLGLSEDGEPEIREPVMDVLRRMDETEVILRRLKTFLGDELITPEKHREWAELAMQPVSSALKVLGSNETN
ncbi:hypothetical protein ACSBOX_04505 [Arthrobacter sp. KN11-1C]|uniref:hypothetical protein n=1 Tax=Arthrobacter sp. KN11-1C TaxID=3445774 RepID=UPI003FA01271